MTKARSKEGPRAPLFYFLALLPVWASPVAAQTVEISELEICAGLETPELKLACFEAIIATARHPATVASDANTESASARVVVSGEPQAVPDPVVAAAEIGQQPEPGPDPSIQRAAENAPIAPQAEPSRQVGVAAVPQASAAAAASADSFGSEHLAKEESDDPRVLNATVVEVTRGTRGVLVFQLDNGQVWRQIEPRYYPYPRDREFDVTISTGMMGEYRLQVEGAGRRVTIRRVK